MHSYSSGALWTMSTLIKAVFFMTREAMTTELLAKRQQAKMMAQDVKQTSRLLSEKKLSLKQVIREYNAMRIELFKKELQARCVTWCTYCSKVIPEAEAQLLLIELNVEDASLSGATIYGYRNISLLQRACPTCRKLAADNHEWMAVYNSVAHEFASRFEVFRVEQRNEDYYANKDGDWMKIESYPLAEPSIQLINRFTKEWQLPRRIKYREATKE